MTKSEILCLAALVGLHDKGAIDATETLHAVTLKHRAVLTWQSCVGQGT